MTDESSSNDPPLTRRETAAITRLIREYQANVQKSLEASMPEFQERLLKRILESLEPPMPGFKERVSKRNRGPRESDPSPDDDQRSR